MLGDTFSFGGGGGGDDWCLTGVGGGEICGL